MTGIINQTGSKSGVIGTITAPATSGGDMVLVGQHSTSSNLSILKIEDNFQDTSYFSYKIIGHVTPTAEATLTGEFGYGGGSTSYLSSNNKFLSDLHKYNGSTHVDEKTQSSSSLFSVVSAGSASTDGGVFFEVDIVQPYEAVRYKMARVFVQVFQGNDYISNYTGAWMNNGSGGENAITAFKCSFTSGSINGDIRLYGIKGE